MEKEDLKLVPMKDLIDEIYNRTIVCAIGYLRHDDPGEPYIYVNWHGDSEMAIIGVCEAIKHRMLVERDKRPDVGIEPIG